MEKSVWTTSAPTATTPCDAPVERLQWQWASKCIHKMVEQCWKLLEKVKSVASRGCQNIVSSAHPTPTPDPIPTYPTCATHNFISMFTETLQDSTNPWKQWVKCTWTRSALRSWRFHRIIWDANQTSKSPPKRCLTWTWSYPKHPQTWKPTWWWWWIRWSQKRKGGISRLRSSYAYEYYAFSSFSSKSTTFLKNFLQRGNRFFREAGTTLSNACTLCPNLKSAAAVRHIPEATGSTEKDWDPTIRRRVIPDWWGCSEWFLWKYHPPVPSFPVKSLFLQVKPIKCPYGSGSDMGHQWAGNICGLFVIDHPNLRWGSRILSHSHKQKHGSLVLTNSSQFNIDSLRWCNLFKECGIRAIWNEGISHVKDHFPMKQNIKNGDVKPKLVIAGPNSTPCVCRLVGIWSFGVGSQSYFFQSADLQLKHGHAGHRCRVHQKRGMKPTINGDVTGYNRKIGMDSDMFEPPVIEDFKIWGY